MNRIMKVGFIGFGNMAQALAEGFAATGALKPCQIGACARDRAKLRRNTAVSYTHLTLPTNREV